MAKYLKDNHITLAGLVETRIKQYNASAIAPKIVQNWELVHNYDHGVNGRIWVLFNRNVWHMDVVQISSCNFNCALTVVYGYNSLEMGKDMRQKLRNLAQTINQPWLLWGDFNAIITAQDRL